MSMARSSHQTVADNSTILTCVHSHHSMNLPQPPSQEGEDSFGRPAVLEAITLALDHEDSHSDRDSGGVRRVRS